MAMESNLDNIFSKNALSLIPVESMCKPTDSGIDE